jgi:hypothetical protein
MTAFENFVTTELPRRSSHLTVEIIGYDGDPNDPGAPDGLKGAPKGTWYMRETPSVTWYRKEVSGVGGATSWVVPGGVGVHATTHSDGGSDEIDVSNLGSASAPGSGYMVQSNGAGGLAWVTASAPALHASTHQHGGLDEVATATPAANAISKADGSGKLDGWISAASETVPGRIELATQAEVDGGTDPVRAVTPATLAGTTVTPAAHVASHQTGGADKLSVAGLSGLLADPQTPAAHNSSHHNGGADEINVSGLSGTLADPQPPSTHASTHNAGGADALAIDAAAGTGSLRTLGTGAQQAVAGNDSRLSDARTPTSHAATHDVGGADPMAVDAAAGTGSLRTLGTGAQQAVAGNDARLSDARTPTSHASTHQSGGADALALDTLAAATDNTNLDATTSVHGLLPKLGGGTTDFLRADGSWAVPPGGGGGGAGWIYCTDAATQGSGTVTSKTYQDTGNTVLQSFTSSSTALRLSLRASYPKVEVNTTAAQLTRDAGGGFYSGNVDVTVAASGDIAIKVLTADNEDGATDTTNVTLDLPPTITSLTFTGGYPGSQTELKAGDTFQVTGTTDKAINQVEFQNYEAFVFGQVVASGTAFTVSGTIADRGNTAVARPGRVRVRDASTGAYSATRDTNFGGGTTDGTHTVVCNDLRPSVSFGVVSYPASQSALKNSESAGIVSTITNANTVLYDSPTSELSIANPTSIATPKVCTRIAGNYNVSTPNVRATANRAANDATTATSAVINIAHVALQLTVTPPAARLRSGGNDGTSIQNHTITITGDQQLYQAPVLDEDTGNSGTFIGSWVGGGTTWTRTLQVHDDDDKGTKSWQNPSAVNLAGIITTSITTGSTYVLGGFVARTLTFAAFQQSTALNVAVVTYTKLTAGIFTATNQSALRNATQGNQSDIVDTYTILSPLGNNPQSLWWNDVSAAGSNSSGTAQITNVQEAV